MSIFLQPSNSESLVLMVSYKQKPFQQAQFPQSSEGQRLTEKVCKRYLHIHTYVSMHMCVHMCVYVCVCVCVCACVRVYVHMRTCVWE